jgi:hypothetical protein
MKRWGKGASSKGGVRVNPMKEVVGDGCSRQRKWGKNVPLEGGGGRVYPLTKKPRSLNYI